MSKTSPDNETFIDESSAPVNNKCNSFFLVRTLRPNESELLSNCSMPISCEASILSDE
jgi:hypothetical protein